MKPAEFPPDLQPFLIPAPTGDLVYQCLECGKEYDIRELLYTCPACRGLFLLIDRNEARLKGRLPVLRAYRAGDSPKGHYLLGGRPHPSGGGQ